MKNKSAVLFSVAALALLAVVVQAAPGVRGAKGSVSIFGSASPVGVSTGTYASLKNPGVLYSVVIGTGAVTDFVVLFDTNSAVGLTSALQGTNGYVMRLYASSATQNTQYTFDPPIQFNNGIIAGNSTVLMSSVITYEKGRQPNGY